MPVDRFFGLQPDLGLVAGSLHPKEVIVLIGQLSPAPIRFQASLSNHDTGGNAVFFLFCLGRRGDLLDELFDRHVGRVTFSR